MSILINKLLEKIQKNKLPFYGLGLLLVIVFIFFTFFYDIGINSKYFIKKDFSDAFLFRQTGNCDEFAPYVNQDRENWVKRCNDEKYRDNSAESIKSFSINQITVNGNKGFLLVDLQRDKKDYSFTYEMVRKNGSWFINQEIK